MSNAQVRPATTKAPARDLTAGKSNTEIEVSRGNTEFFRIITLQNLRYMVLFGMLCKVLGWPDYDDFRHSTPGVSQDNWRRRGLFLTYLRTYDLRDRADIVVACTDRETWEKFLRVLSRMSKGVL